MKTFSHLSPEQQADIVAFNHIHFNLSNFNNWLNNPELPHPEIAFLFEEFLTEIYNRYENKNNTDSSNHLENS